MSWSISVRDVPTISSYEEALAIWNKAEAWRNKSVDQRQLAGRRAFHKRLEKRHNNRIDCMLYETAVVSYHADGCVELATHDTQSTNMFAWCVRPVGCAPVNHKGQMFWKIQTVDGDRYYQPLAGQTLYLSELDEKGNRVLQSTGSVRRFSEFKYIPKVGAAVRKKLKPYLDWHKMTERVGGMRFAHNTVSQLRIEQLLLCTDPAEFPEFAEELPRPEFLLPEAYQLEGAYIAQPAPFDRLPRTLT